VNGDDVLEMREATQKAVERARKTKMPFFLEAKTYRFRGHSMSDPAKYRTREEVDQWMQRDPLAILAAASRRSASRRPSSSPRSTAR
jgi:pyruvate dehydrogenase E1 component alpha subunit